MKNNNKISTNNLLIIIMSIIIAILIVLLIIAWQLLSKPNYSTNSSEKSFGTFKTKNSKAVNNSVPSSLRWSDPFTKDKGKDNQKPQGSYLHYLSEQNKKK